MNELWMPMIDSPIQVTRNTATMVMICAISQRSSVSPIRSTIAVARAAMPGRRHEQQPVAIDAGLGRKGDP